MDLSKNEEEWFWKIVDYQNKNDMRFWCRGKSVPRSVKSLERKGLIVGRTIVNNYWMNSGSDNHITKKEGKYIYSKNPLPEEWFKPMTYWEVQITPKGESWAHGNLDEIDD